MERRPLSDCSCNGSYCLMISNLHRLFRWYIAPSCRIQAYGHVMGCETVRDRALLVFKFNTLLMSRSVPTSS